MVARSITCTVHKFLSDGYFLVKMVHTSSIFNLKITLSNIDDHLQTKAEAEKGPDDPVVFYTKEGVTELKFPPEQEFSALNLLPMLCQNHGTFHCTINTRALSPPP